MFDDDLGQALTFSQWLDGRAPTPALFEQYTAYTMPWFERGHPGAVAFDTGDIDYWAAVDLAYGPGTADALRDVGAGFADWTKLAAYAIVGFVALVVILRVTR